jgi:hypothetical protein
MSLEVRIAICCYSRVVSANFCYAILDHLINSFGITKIIIACQSDITRQSLIENHQGADKNI